MKGERYEVPTKAPKKESTKIRSWLRNQSTNIQTLIQMDGGAMSPLFLGLSITYPLIDMKIGDKKQKRFKKLLVTVERIKFDWKAAIVWLLVILVAWYVFFR